MVQILSILIIVVGRKISSEQRATLCKLQGQLAYYIFHNLKSQKMFSVDGSSKSQEIHSHAAKLVSKIFRSLCTFKGHI